ncbi:Cleavage polyadenylation factor subunit clp1 [Coemansia biformis]|uniref:Polynucleotide 5'-hydroxyl-kinase GRC3 n=1 Tax=Coemansia biformis TaxID=1286918 RepID=A0A9W7YFV6_9FUNG|nr:Cleavage polyadenylation factor subunit clp1 [Coemansia biformis]
MSSTAATKEWVLNAGEELRFEVDFRQTIELRLKSGCAEYFGAELGREATYVFSGENGAIFTWQGCTLAVAGECSSAYVAGETPMDSYINVHMAAQQLRMAAHQAQELGEKGEAPRIMIVGPEDSGKTSLARLLLNYAVRQGETPVFVDLDPTDATVTVPGTVSAIPVTKTLDIESGFMDYAMSSSYGQPETPLVWQFGHDDPGTNPSLFNILVDRAAQAINRRMGADARVAGAGIVVDTRGLSDISKDQVTMHAIEALGINILLVIGNERMYSLLDGRLTERNESMRGEAPPVSVVKLARSGGTVDRSALYRQQLNAKVVRQYFYGTGREEVSSFSTVVNFDDIQILRVGEDVVAPSSTLPLGEDRKVTDTTVAVVEPDESLMHSILAVTDAPRQQGDGSMSVDAGDAGDADGVVGIQAIGFVSVSKVEMERQRLIIVSPVPGRLQKHVLLYGNTKWVETS